MTQRDETHIRWYVQRSAKGMNEKQGGGHDNHINAIGRGIEYQWWEETVRETILVRAQENRGIIPQSNAGKVNEDKTLQECAKEK